MSTREPKLLSRCVFHLCILRGDHRYVNICASKVWQLLYRGRHSLQILVGVPYFKL